MATTPRRKTNLEKEQTKWYAKLRKSGFDDIEYRGGFIRKDIPRPDSPLQDETYRETYQAYYYMACHFLNEYPFKNKVEKIIWEYHTEGIGVRGISKLLKQVKVAKLSKDAVHKIVRRLETEMKKRYLVG